MTILELKTGLFPDADSLGKAVCSIDGEQNVIRMDITELSTNDEDGWMAVATAVLSADLVVTL